MSGDLYNTGREERREKLVRNYCESDTGPNYHHDMSWRPPRMFWIMLGTALFGMSIISYFMHGQVYDWVQYTGARIGDSAHALTPTVQ